MRVVKVLSLIMLVIFATPSPGDATEQIKWDKVPQRTKMVLFKAQQEMNENNYPKAIEILSKFREKKSKYNHFLVEFNLGTAYGLSQQTDKAIYHLEQASEMEPNYSAIWMNLGKLYYQAKDFLRAGAALERGFNSATAKDPATLFMAMASYFQGNDLVKTIAVGEKLVFEYHSMKDEVVSLLANAYITTKDFEGAIRMLNVLLERNPNNGKAWKLLCHAYFNNQQYVEATISYEVYGYINGLSHDELLVMGDLFFMSGVPLRAAQYYEEALRDGGSPEEHEKLSVYYYSSFEIDAALTSLETALSKEETVERLLLKAQLHYLQEEFGKAEQYYASAAEKLSKDGHEWLMAGYCAMRNGDNSRAKQLLNKAMDYPSQRQEAQSILKIMAPAEEIKKLMKDYKEHEAI
jgi:tetratricopeptide (TPR) repeat protein